MGMWIDLLRILNPTEALMRRERKMTDAEILEALSRLKVQTGSLACLGCGYEHNCGVHGCRIMREAADMIEKLTDRCARYDEEIAVLQEREKWVPVTERLPDTEKQDYVLVCVTEKCSKIEYQNAVVMAFVSEEGFVDVEMDYLLQGVTHWRPLPDGPEETHE
uniref:DUF551 domain-containing protein n=1 Tax=Siphoviridae sp. cty3u30 TaxID=2825744 RepID=A0A8S5Q6N1_9CAUD|nr:MAG TPA: Protein of unknown function (DUF551) [Siphoviridae sp. cty3u30]